MSKVSSNNAQDDSQLSGPGIFTEDENGRTFTNGNLRTSLRDLEKRQSDVTDGNKGAIK